MIFPKKFIKRGKFKLHSGRTTNIFYDVNMMLTDGKVNRKEKIKDKVPWSFTTVGIATGGAIIASQFHNWGMVKDGEYKGPEVDEYCYCLVDDVCTTEKSIREAIKIIGKVPDKIFVVVDRRKGQRKLKIKSMYDVGG